MKSLCPRKTLFWEHVLSWFVQYVEQCFWNPFQATNILILRSDIIFIHFLGFGAAYQYPHLVVFMWNQTMYFWRLAKTCESENMYWSDIDVRTPGSNYILSLNYIGRNSNYTFLTTYTGIKKKHSNHQHSGHNWTKYVWQDFVKTTVLPFDECVWGIYQWQMHEWLLKNIRSPKSGKWCVYSIRNIDNQLINKKSKKASPRTILDLNSDVFRNVRHNAL